MKEIQSKDIFDKNDYLSLLLIDEKNNHEYFLHKYNVSNELKDNLNIVAENFIYALKDKNFFQKNLKKKYFSFWKRTPEITESIIFFC